MATKSSRVAVVAVPFPAQGHLNQLLHLSLFLSHHSNIHVHYACTTTHNRQVKLRLQGWDFSDENNNNGGDLVTFHDLEFPSFPSPLPNPELKDKFPIHLEPLFMASLNLEAPLSSLLKTISAAYRRVVVIHDPYVPFAAQLAKALPDCESFCFNCIPSFLSLPVLWSLTGEYDAVAREGGVPEFVFSRPQETISEEFMSFIFQEILTRQVADESMIFNTSRAMEGEIIGLLEKEPSFLGRKIYAVGPIHPVFKSSQITKSSSFSRHKCLEWLDKQPPESVLYVAFGSTTTLSDAEIEQLAIGLRQSRRRFIWVLRDADCSDIFAADVKVRRAPLPPEFEREIDGVGLVVRDWAPQLDILSHPSTAAFMSHCGWNSCLEAMSFGVPIIAWPMHSDQPLNGLMITDYLKTGLLVREWDRRREVVPASEISELIKKTVNLAGEEEEEETSKDLRARAKELGEAIRASVKEGGSSHADLKSLVAHITRP